MANRLVTVPDGLEVSHLCHNGRYVDPNDIVTKDHNINASRKDAKKRVVVKSTVHMTIKWCFCFVLSRCSKLIKNNVGPGSMGLEILAHPTFFLASASLLALRD